MDPRYPEPIVRMDISKSDLMGDYYLHIASYKYKLGEVKIKKLILKISELRSGLQGYFPLS